MGYSVRRRTSDQEWSSWCVREVVTYIREWRLKEGQNQYTLREEGSRTRGDRETVPEDWTTPARQEKRNLGAWGGNESGAERHPRRQPGEENPQMRGQEPEERRRATSHPKRQGRLWRARKSGGPEATGHGEEDPRRRGADHITEADLQRAGSDNGRGPAGGNKETQQDPESTQRKQASDTGKHQANRPRGNPEE